MKLLLGTNLRLATDSLRRTKTRSFLTTLGIGIGVASIVLILSLTGSVKQLVSSQVKTAGSDLIIVRPASNKKSTTDNIISDLTGATQYQNSTLTSKDLEAIKSNPSVFGAAPIGIMETTAVVGDAGLSGVAVVTTNPELDEILGLKMYAGQFLSSNMENTAAVGFKLAMTLFGTNDAIGRSVKIGENTFLITGVLDQTNNPINFNNVDFDNSLFVNIGTSWSTAQIQQINISVSSVAEVDTVKEQVREAISKTHLGADDFTVMVGDEITHPAGSLLSAVSLMLALVAGVSLVVGGIGVMNIMLVSVGERTREIGIRKAVGAAGTHILLQFLFEALILCLMGGVIGLLLGYIMAFVVSLTTPFPPYFDIAVLGWATLVALAIGLVFGILPALRAASKNPIESLKFYR